MTDRAALLVAGAVVGVISVLVALAALVNSVDSHFVTRREYEATIVSINEHLSRLETRPVVLTQRTTP